MDETVAKFFNLNDISSDWSLTCTIHGDISTVLVFGGDLKNRSYCQECFEDMVAQTLQKPTFKANGAPNPAVIEV